MPKCSVNRVSCANLRTFSRKPLGTTSCKVTLFPFVNCQYNKPFFRTNLVSPLFKPRLTVMLPDSTLPLILSKFGSIAWACFKASLSSLIIWSGTLSFLQAFSLCLAWDQVTAAAEKWDISRSFDPSIFPITRSSSVSSMHKASVFPVKNGQSTSITAKGYLCVVSSIKVT